MRYKDKTMWDTIKLTRIQSLPGKKFWKSLSPTFLHFGEQEELCAAHEAVLKSEFQHSWQQATESIICGLAGRDQCKKYTRSRLKKLGRRRKDKAQSWEYILPQSVLLHAWLAFRMAEAAAKQTYTSNPIQIDGGDNHQMLNLVSQRYTPENRSNVDACLDNDSKAIGLWMVDYVRTVLIPRINELARRYFGKAHADIPEYFPLKYKIYYTEPSNYWHNPDKKGCIRLLESWLSKTIRGPSSDLECVSAIDVFLNYVSSVNHVYSHFTFVKELYAFFNEDSEIYRTLENGVCPGAFHAVRQRILNISIGDISKPLFLRQKLSPPRK
ncbi:MAG TPA: hypothetical protein PLD40_03835 [Kiritimatiellia bacterium]|nr:hypothetical protein [Kiritimatiellia bacterium]HOE37245.1 hypothetical protein [Kiritimatiellia bacterium]HOR74186.1 hypothetical protein [Kiritimatiellia bacterium]HOU58729.1 hypothetical protein [Kiritimatiellia bacterium]HPK69189.1 hypothetical protein [Kiritimatiellia bacterium]